MSKPVILVTNDDGIFAPGIKTLISIVSTLGRVIVVAPDSPQSGQGHAITITEPLRVKAVNSFDGIEAYSCSGTPVDCVKLAKHQLFKDTKIDLCVSGINHGSNASINIIYSGTMSAAMEASLIGIPSIGFSLCDYSNDADFNPSKPFIKKIIESVLNKGMAPAQLLNVNIPATKTINGMKVARQAEARWVENFQEGTDPFDRPYYWLTGEFVNQDEGEDTDVWALNNGFISIVPSQHDLTDYKAIQGIQHFESL